VPENRLGRLPDVGLWRDNRDFKQLGLVIDKLKEAVQKSNLFLPVLSNHYRIKGLHPNWN